MQSAFEKLIKNLVGQPIIKVQDLPTCTFITLNQAHHSFQSWLRIYFLTKKQSQLLSHDAHSRKSSRSLSQQCNTQGGRYV